MSDKERERAANTCVIGVAGHIDHGKTILVKALTGVDTDRLPAEKQRGVSIELGFAPLKLPNNIKASIVDVPGHEKFLKNMLAGATGIDLLLLVVAADDGVMPQTLEHLEISELLGVGKAVAAITKIDLVDEERCRQVETQVRKTLATTRFQRAPIIMTSARLGQGIDELKAALAAATMDLPPRNTDLPWRLPIDRVFSLKGAGTIVTGTLWSGTISTAAAAEVMPSGRKVRIRNLQIHNITVDKAAAGQRVAVNLAGVAKSEIKRGEVLAAAGAYHATNKFAAYLRVSPNSPEEIKSGVQVRLYHGTARTTAKIRLIEGRQNFALINLKTPMTLYYGDYFIIRAVSSGRVLGGGRVLSSRPLSGRPAASLIEELKILASGRPAEIVKLIIEREGELPLSTTAVTETAELPRPVVEQALRRLSRQKVIQQIEAADDDYWLTSDTLTSLQAELAGVLRRFHQENPLLAGLSKEELINLLKLPAAPDKYNPLINYWRRLKLINVNREFISSAEVAASVNSRVNLEIERLESLLDQRPFSPPTAAEAAEALNLSSKEINSLVKILRENDRVIIVSGFIFPRSAIIESKKHLTSYLAVNNRITVSTWRQLLNTSRKYALPLLEYFDKQKLTRRVDNYRVLNKPPSQMD